MEPAIALDYVQNVTGDRDDAVTALIHAGCDWLAAQEPQKVAGDLDAVCHSDADLVLGHLRGEGIGMAVTFASHIEERCGFASHPASGRERWIASDWLAWVRKASDVIDWCRKIVTAAHPQEAAAT
jgi:hypothetical protein